MKRKPTVRVALVWSFVLNGGKDSILLLLTFVLAALLGPRDFGTVAMANAFLLISEMLLDLGLTAALVQRRELRDEHLDSAFWTVVGWSVVLMIVSVCLAPWWALANELPELRNVIWALAILLPIHGLVLVQNTVMQRALDFRSLAIRSNVAALTAGAVSLTAALFGWGVWALVLQRVTLGVVGLVLLWSISSWRPRLRFDYTAARELFGFSFGALLGRIAVFTTSKSDALLMGFFFGPVAVGIYQLGYRLVNVFIDLATRSIQPVAMASFSKIQDRPEELRRGVGRYVWMSASLAVPALTVLAVSSRELVALLGDEWLPAALPAALLSVMGMVHAIMVFVGPVTRAIGRPYVDAAMKWGFAIPTVLSLTTVAWLVGDTAPRDQAAAIAASRAVLFGLVFLPVSAFVVKRLLPGVALFVPLLPSLLACLGGAAAVLALDAVHLLPREPVLLAALAKGVVATALVYGALLLADADLRSSLRDLASRMPAWFPGSRVVPATGDDASDD